jgi:hypothetical protein
VKLVIYLKIQNTAPGSKTLAHLKNQNVMRRLLCILITISLLGLSCQKSPDFDQLSANFIVATNLDPKTNFANYKTYYISDTIAVATTNPNDSLWFDAKAKQLVDAVKQNMASRGFQFVPKGAKPDMGINMIAVKNVSIGVVYPGWGWGYGGYWDPWYWGWYYPYYYPWSVAYSVTTGTVAFDLINLKNAQADQKLSILWTSVMGGALGLTSDDIANGVNAINQAFTQSPTVKTN